MTRWFFQKTYGYKYHHSSSDQSSVVNSGLHCWKVLEDTECSLNIAFFKRILESLPPLPRQHSAAIGCTKNYQPIGVTVHSHCVESFEGLLQRCRRGRGCSELWKNTIFPEHLVYVKIKNKFFLNSARSACDRSNLWQTNVNAAWGQHMHSYWLEIFCTTNSSRVLARKKWQTLDNSWKKNTIFN